MLAQIHQAVAPLPLRAAAAQVPHEGAQVRQLPLQVLGHVLLPFQPVDYLLLSVPVAPAPAGGGVRGWGRDGLGTGARGRGGR